MLVTGPLPDTCGSPLIPFREGDVLGRNYGDTGGLGDFDFTVTLLNITIIPPAVRAIVGTLHLPGAQRCISMCLYSTSCLDNARRHVAAITILHCLLRMLLHCPAYAEAMHVACLCWAAAVSAHVISPIWTAF